MLYSILSSRCRWARRVCVKQVEITVLWPNLVFPVFLVRPLTRSPAQMPVACSNEKINGKRKTKIPKIIQNSIWKRCKCSTTRSTWDRCRRNTCGGEQTCKISNFFHSTQRICRNRRTHFVVSVLVFYSHSVFFCIYVPHTIRSFSIFIHSNLAAA